MPEPQRMGPLADDNPLTFDGTCEACRQRLKVGDFVTLIALGPGIDEEERAKARAGRPYNGVAAVVHWACATGRDE